ncbi:hypothetical protein P3W23_11930 [Luteibacter sp. PPL554]
METRDMTSLPALPLRVHPRSRPGIASRTRLDLKQKLLATNPAILDQLARPLGELGRTGIDFRFGAGDVQSIDPYASRAFGELVIVTGKHGAFVEPMDEEANEGPERYALIGKHRSENECLLLFRHAFGAVTCHFTVNSVGPDARIGFLRHTQFAEVRGFTVSTPSRMSRERAAFETVLRYRATELNELQGIVFRGGALGIERIILTP